MDRLMNYAGAIPLETDLLITNRNAMIAVGYALQGYLGQGTVVDGFPMPLGVRVDGDVSNGSTLSTWQTAPASGRVPPGRRWSPSSRRASAALGTPAVASKWRLKCARAKWFPISRGRTASGRAAIEIHPPLSPAGVNRVAVISRSRATALFYLRVVPAIFCARG